MNDSEKAWEIRLVADAKYERYAQSVAEQLNQSDAGYEDPASPCTTCWEEWKVHLHGQPHVNCARLEENVRAACLALLDGLPDDERRVLWLGSEAPDSAKSELFGRTRSSEVVADLYERVEDLAREQAKEEASFGRGFFQTRDELLPLISDVLEVLSRRPNLDDEARMILSRLIATIKALPSQEPPEFIKLDLGHRATYEGSGGCRIYSLAVLPDSLELSVGGAEWAKGIGSDSWSGARLTVEADGSRSEDGDINEVLNQMLDAAADSDYELSFEHELREDLASGASGANEDPNGS